MRSAMIVLILVTIPISAFSATIRVPKDFTTIQAAMDAAISGDTVLVEPGTYVENINFNGKAITVKSTDGAAQTVIDGGQPSKPDFESVVTFNNNEGMDTVLDGFSIINGDGTFMEQSPGFWVHLGGGVLCLNASPLLRNNIFKSNNAFIGGGIYCFDSSPDITNNIFNKNTAFFGAGICCESFSSPFISNNTLADNSAGVIGGGICCTDNSSAVITNSILWDNSAPTGPEIWIGTFSTNPSILTIRYSDVKGGQALVHIDPNCILNWGVGMITADPLFFNSLISDFHLKQSPPQPGVTNPCVDAGEDTAGNLGFSSAWTRTDLFPDTGIVDMGYHYGPYPTETLFTDTFVIHQSTGGMVTLSLKAGPENMGRTYLIFSGVSGTVPGFSPPPGLVNVPVNWDIFTNLALMLTNTTVFQNFSGILDASGEATAVFYTLGPFTGGAGLNLSFAFALDFNIWDFASNPVTIEVVP